MKKLILASTAAVASAAFAQVIVQPAQQVVVQQPVQQVVVPQPVQPVIVQQGTTLPNGTVMPIGAKVCPKCDGTGIREHFLYSEKCSHCKGYGYRMPHDNGPDVIFVHEKDRHHDHHDDRHHDHKKYSSPPPGYTPVRPAPKVAKPAPKVVKPAPKPAPVHAKPPKDKKKK